MTFVEDSSSIEAPDIDSGKVNQLQSSSYGAPCWILDGEPVIFGTPTETKAS
ncbi:MAG: hypothetical protein KME29_31600 [Calothrix sp. FI2-JRJ7]|nr:hypothetical protein [Calothrix sp. FI2-JRJ7]